MRDPSISSQSNRGPNNSDIIRTQSSIIEEIRIDRNTGFVTISYLVYLLKPELIE